ncbi:response regulator transcription factor [Cohnella caldifontis]|uniref:response regulator transcription factor n=1 Tax=Cohnella caldifontis TaxID=3027471 RepID=UPI0023ECD79D|nr:response regulator transcription factor [Cohnella sp. YIM B05605]
MTERQTVMVVDDDPSIVELLRDFLENDGFLAVTACDAEEALEKFRQDEPQCVLLDIMMPGQSGFELCRTLRETSDVPILFLSARGGDVDKIRGLGLGADDYIVKTASPGEVVARVKAVLRRYRPSRPHVPPMLQAGRLSLDFAARAVYADGRELPLTPKEYDLLRLFCENPRQVFTYEQLLDRFWDGVGDKHTVRVHIARLREKIEIDPERPRYLANVWGVGYRFEAKP